MSIPSSKDLREVIRILERKLGSLENCQTSCCDVTMAQCHAIVEIGRAKNISLNALSKLLDLEISTMSRTVNNLVINGFVQRDINEKDRRFVTISLTENGQKVFSDIENSMNQYYESIFKKIPSDKRNQVIESIYILIGLF